MVCLSGSPRIKLECNSPPLHTPLNPNNVFDKDDISRACNKLLTLSKSENNCQKLVESLLKWFNTGQIELQKGSSKNIYSLEIEYEIKEEKRKIKVTPIKTDLDEGYFRPSLLTHIELESENVKTTDNDRFDFINYPDHKSLDNVLDAVYDNYYKDWNYKYIIDRGPAGTPDNLNLLKKYFKQPIKIIFLVRPILEILASWIDWASKTPDSFIREIDTPKKACSFLMSEEGQIMKQLKCMDNLLKTRNKHCKIVCN